MHIYEIVNTINQKRYIGQTIQNPLYRWATHRRELNYNRHHNIHLQRAWNKYGDTSFTFNVVQVCNNIVMLDEIEQQTINKFSSQNQCYNIAEGGQLNRGTTYCKVWNGLISPDGTVYNNVSNLAEFARTHNLNEKCLRNVAVGSKFSYKGWTLKGRSKKIGYRCPKGKKLSIETRTKMSIAHLAN